MKKCIDCGKNKLCTDYYCDKQGNPKQNFCKKCQNIRYKNYRNRYRKNNHEKVKQWKKNSRIKNIEKYIYNAARLRAKNKKQLFTITLEDIIIPEYCPILGIKIDPTLSGRSGHSPSVDRLDNNQGYTKENILIISDRANTLKSDSSKEERQKIYKYYFNLIREK